MFKKYYKQANDDIKTNRELIDKIFEEAAKPTKKKKMMPIYKYGITAAAVVAVSVSGILFVQFGTENNGTIAEKPLTIAKNDNHKIDEVKPENISETIIKDNVSSDAEGMHNEQSVAESEQSQSETKIESIEISEKDISGSKNDVDDEKTVHNTYKEQNDNTGSQPINESSDEGNIQTIEPIFNEQNQENIGKDNVPVLAAEIHGEQNGIAVREVMVEENAHDEDAGFCETKLDSLAEVSEAEVTVLNGMLISYFGETDEMTGNLNVFEIVGKNDEVYVGRWKWLVGDHLSLITDFVVTSGMSEMYECSYEGDSVIRWETENNLLNN